MGWGDNRKSPKMRRRRSHARYKARQKRHLEALRKERAEKKSA